MIVDVDVIPTVIVAVHLNVIATVGVIVTVDAALLRLMTVQPRTARAVDIWCKREHKRHF